MNDYAEKRNYIRMTADCPVSIRDFNATKDESAFLLDLSAGGVRFISRRALDQGARLQLMVRPSCDLTPPLEAEIAVVRCNEIEAGFDIAASIEMVAPAVYPESA
ncbi:MAG: PilZ domain-containing protein [Chromatiaceae bacterium]|nr:PilZ domain-containing protein [Gammaproteobacteria bacterium]MCP5300186.1 PilZ domain-containing protein [Chromatiaceae bacterium]MCP5422258.1 PilZ domain-containing protein [Chromatiaceae bacterium]